MHCATVNSKSVSKTICPYTNGRKMDEVVVRQSNEDAINLPYLVQDWPQLAAACFLRMRLDCLAQAVLTYKRPNQRI